MKPAPRPPLLLAPALAAYLGQYLEMMNKSVAVKAKATVKSTETPLPVPAAQSCTASAPHPS